MRKRLIEWLIKVLLKGYHLHRDPVRKEIVDGFHLRDVNESL